MPNSSLRELFIRESHEGGLMGHFGVKSLYADRGHGKRGHEGGKAAQMQGDSQVWIYIKFGA